VRFIVCRPFVRSLLRIWCEFWLLEDVGAVWLSGKGSDTTPGQWLYLFRFKCFVAGSSFSPFSVEFGVFDNQSSVALLAGTSTFPAQFIVGAPSGLGMDK